MIYPEVIREDRFRCQKHLFIVGSQPQPQLAIAATAAAALETKLKHNNDHRCPFWFN